MRRVRCASGLVLDEGQWRALGLGLVPFPEPEPELALTSAGGPAPGRSSKVTPQELRDLRQTRAFIKARREKDRLRKLVHGNA